MKYLFLLLTLILSACSTVNSNFSCNKTAGDACFTIEEIDAMTEYADEPYIRKATKPCPGRYQKSGIWMRSCSHVQ